MSQILVLIVLLGVLVALLKEWVAPSIAFLFGLAILMVLDIVPIDTAFSGFSNENLIIIASLFVIARAIEHTISIEAVTQKLFGNSKNVRLSLLRIMAPVSLSSAFVNNTPVVAMLINPIIQWSRTNKLHASKFLLPLSYAAVFGGTITLIGTSTNLVVSGLLSSYGYEPFSFFELTRYGLPLTVGGLGLVTWLGPKLLPVRTLADIGASQISKDFTIDMLPKGAAVGKTVAQAKLRKLGEVFLVEIIRKNGDVITPVSPQTKLKNGDVLRFSGDAKPLSNLTLHPSLVPVEKKHTDKLIKSNVYIEAVVGHDKSVVSKTLSEIGFRAKYQAAVLAIFRSGERVSGSLGQATLKPGDSLLLVSDEGFVGRWRERGDFLYLRRVGTSKSSDNKGSLSIAFVILVVLALLAAGLPLAVSTMAGALSAVAFKILNTHEAREAIDFDLLIMIAAAIGVAQGVDTSGLANSISTVIINLFGPLGVIGLLLGVMVATSILTELLTNAAAALLVLPIAISTAVSSGADPRMFAIAVALMASLSFISPFGYQTNTMVYSAGGYKFKDFIRLGIVLNIFVTAALTLLLMLSF